jgi:hypothetical protein
MNERIEKLIEQCTVQNFSDCTGGFETFDKDKFVQLIVRECCQFENSYGGEAGLVARHYSRKIKEHFGVEE